MCIRDRLQVACECLDWLHELSGQALCENHTYSYYCLLYTSFLRCSGCIFLCKLSCGKKCMDMILSNCFAYLMVQLFLITSKLSHVSKHCYCPALCM